MELFTLISLLIGVFGGTYASLNSIRTNLHEGLKDAAATAESRRDAFLALNPKCPAVEDCREDCKRILFWKNTWEIAHLVPAIAFSGAIALVTIWVLWDWKVVMVGHTAEELAALSNVFPWCGFRLLVSAVFFIGLASIALALWSRHKCRSADGRLKLLGKTKPTPPILTDPGT